MKPKKILFISNVDIRNRRGGWDGLGGKIYDLLCEAFEDVGLAEKLTPPVDTFARITSKILRILRWPANFPAFSPKRLKQYADLVTQNIDPAAGHLVFHGSTQWVDYRPAVPYSVYIDCAYLTYLQVYHRIGQYSKRDIERIKRKERDFLMRAHRVLFTSAWALEETRRNYALAGTNFISIGLGPLLNIAPEDSTPLPVRNQFLFVGIDFLGKGG